MLEIVFLVEEDPEGGYFARALGESIFAQAEDLASLRENVRDALNCHFPDPETRPRIVRLHEVRDESSRVGEVAMIRDNISDSDHISDRDPPVVLWCAAAEQ